MKVNVVKAFIAFGISLLIGLLCFEIAKEDDFRNWISLAVSTMSIFICLGSAIACDYNCGYRIANIKVSAWVFTILTTIANIAFSFFMYNIIINLVIVLLLTLMNIAIVYSLYHSKKE